MARGFQFGPSCLRQGGPKVYGYAGGFGPDTVAEDLERALAAAAGSPYWIDMETRLRTDGWLSREKCERVLGAVQSMLPEPNP